MVKKIFIFVLLSLFLIFSLSCFKEGKKEEKKAKYFCPMHPTYTSDKEGDCPICGMKLVPVEEEKVEAKDEKEKSTIFLSPEMVQKIGVKKEAVEKRNLEKVVKTVGKVEFKEPNLYFINTKYDGWIEKLYADRVGKFVEKGEVLLEIYSPELFLAEQEYLIAFKTGDKSIIDSAKKRLKLWDLKDEQIKDLEEKGEIKKTLKIYSPYSGFIIEKNVIEGQKIGQGENLYKIADLSEVWVIGDVYEYDLPLIKVGDEVDVKLPFSPKENFKGKIDYIYPYINQETRTNKIRVEVKNKDFKLKPEMYANLEIKVSYGEKIAVKKSSVIDLGSKKYVFVVKEDGHLEPRQVEVGSCFEDFYEVLEGLEVGEIIAASSLFLIDSEASLKEALEKMESPHKAHKGH